jgi:putative membrane protein
MAERGLEEGARRSIPSREYLQARLETLVTENRVTIAVTFPLVGAASLLASAAGFLPEPLAFNALALLFGTAVMRLPLVAGLGPLVDRRAGVALLAIAAYTYAIEFVGATTGQPYGRFTYEVALGPMAADTIPLALPLFFLPLVVDGYLLADRVLARIPWPIAGGGARWRVPAAVLAVLTIDLVLDPAAVALGFWRYAAPGAYYGVPLSNYRGWLLSATVAVLLLEWGLDTAALRARATACPFLLDDLVSFVLLWGVVVLAAGHLVPALLAVGIGALLLATGYVPVQAVTAKLRSPVGR